MTTETTMSETTKQGSDLAVVEHRSAGVEPRTMPELRQLAQDAADSKLFAVTTQAQAMMILMSGRDLGLSYAQSMRAFHIIENRPSLSADGMVAVCLCRRDLCEYFRVVESTDERCTVETKRVGNPPRSFTFTMADAERAELVKLNRNGGKGMWHKYPSRMLLARAKSALAREVYTDLLLGLYDPDELESSGRHDRTTAAPDVRLVPQQKAGAGAVVLEVEIDNSMGIAADLLRRMASADTADAVKGVARDVKNALDMGHLGDEDLAALRAERARVESLIAAVAAERAGVAS